MISMRKRFHQLVFLTLCSAWVCRPAFGQAVTCPPAPNMFKASVLSSVSFDPNTNLFTYTYTISSDLTSQQEIADFAVDFAPVVSNVISPKGWTNTNFADRNTVHWKATAAAPLAQWSDRYWSGSSGTLSDQARDFTGWLFFPEPKSCRPGQLLCVGLC